MYAEIILISEDVGIDFSKLNILYFFFNSESVLTLNLASYIMIITFINNFFSSLKLFKPYKIEKDCNLDHLKYFFFVFLKETFYLEFLII